MRDESDENAILYPMTSAEAAYQAIREAIARGEFARGTHLRESELAERVGLSRTPVRNALQRLAADGLIELNPHSGATVLAYTNRDMIELFEVRAILESRGAFLAARNRSGAQIDEMRDLCRRMEALAEDAPDRFGGFAPLNNRLHMAILEASDQRKLEKTAARLIELNFVLQSYRRFDRDELHRSLSEHRRIVDAIANGECELAESLMRVHVFSAQKNFAQ